MEKSHKKKKKKSVNNFKKPMVYDIKVLLSMNDRLSIKLAGDEYKCMQVKEWYEQNPLAVLVENVVNKGPQLRKEVYKQFVQKIGDVNLLELRGLHQQLLK